MSPCGWIIQTWRGFFNVQHNGLFFIHIICCPLNIQMRALAQLVGEMSCRYWNLGSIPRSPHIIHDFCINTFPCSFPQIFHHASQRLGLPSVSDDQSNGHNVNSMIHTQSTTCTQAQKVKKGLYSVGQIASKKPPKRARHPPWFASIFNFYLFSFLIILIVLIAFFKFLK